MRPRGDLVSLRQLALRSLGREATLAHTPPYSVCGKGARSGETPSGNTQSHPARSSPTALDAGSALA
eukprot:8066331-Alexandrium_andersonii.AAC.1